MCEEHILSRRFIRYNFTWNFFAGRVHQELVFQNKRTGWGILWSPDKDPNSTGIISFTGKNWNKGMKKYAEIEVYGKDCRDLKKIFEYASTEGRFHCNEPPFVCHQKNSLRYFFFTLASFFSLEPIQSTAIIIGENVPLFFSSVRDNRKNRPAKISSSLGK